MSAALPAAACAEANDVGEQDTSNGTTCKLGNVIKGHAAKAQISVHADTRSTCNHHELYYGDMAFGRTPAMFAQAKTRMSEESLKMPDRRKNACCSWEHGRQKHQCVNCGDNGPMASTRPHG
eukprot:6163179-Pleurochrysis_carterae.AAC.1